MKKLLLLVWTTAVTLPGCTGERSEEPVTRPNILVAISDDQSWVHAGAYGSQFVSTPAFDRIAEEGVLFANAFAASPGCAPSRGALVLGRYPWQNGRAGNHQSIWPEAYKPLPDYLEEHGYHVGFTGKGVGPFFWALGGREANPAGEEYNQHKNDPPFDHISNIDYAANFEEFLSDRPDDRPFYFWYGAQEPHRRFQQGAGELAGKQKESATVPSFLPDVEAVRIDLLDYANEIEWFDRHLGKIIEKLEEIGELDSTLIVVTGDNGMAFPAAKANCREYGIHVPFAVRWGDKVKPNRVVEDLVSFVDVMPTLFEITGIPAPDTFSFSGKSFTNILFSDRQGLVDQTRKAVFAARERHSSSRYYNLSYPVRAIRTQEYLLIWNCRPERWPAGAPTQLVDGREIDAYTDVDWTPDHNLSMLYLIENRGDSEVTAYLNGAVGKRPEFELYDIKEDPGCMKNLIDEPGLVQEKDELISALMDHLKETDDPRLDPQRQHEFESHRRYAQIREFPTADWTKETSEEESAEIKEWADRDTEPAVSPVSIGDWGVQTERWKLLKEGVSWRLFDTLADPKLESDLSQRKPQTASELVKYYRYWRDQ